MQNPNLYTPKASHVLDAVTWWTNLNVEPDNQALRGASRVMMWEQSLSNLPRPELSSPLGVVLKHKNVSSIEEYNIGDRLKYSRIKQSSKKDIEESRINVKYQEHYRSIWNSAKCKMQSAKYNVQSAKYKVQSAKCKVQYRNFWNNAKY